MKVIIAGGRKYAEYQTAFDFLDYVRANVFPINEVVVGGATGADAIGEMWAKSNQIPVKVFPALWNMHGKKAGPLRNKQMAEYADAVILFPGGAGTINMKRWAERLQLQIVDVVKELALIAIRNKLHEQRQSQ